MKNIQYKDVIPEDIEQCSSCGFETKKLHKAQAWGFQRERTDVYVCDICYCTHTGYCAIYPTTTPELSHVLKSIAYIGNTILERLDDIKNNTK